MEASEMPSIALFNDGQHVVARTHLSRISDASEVVQELIAAIELKDIRVVQILVSSAGWGHISSQDRFSEEEDEQRREFGVSGEYRFDSLCLPVITRADFPVNRLEAWGDEGFLVREEELVE